MRTHKWIPALALILVFFGNGTAIAAQTKELPPKYKKWLEEEVAYIITATERDVFLKLFSDKERDVFIEAFWRQRDPTKGTPENEMQIEHYKRIAYANFQFGRGTPLPGWKTDRGRIHIILGKPNDIQRIEGNSQVYSTEIWFYQNMTEYGLPSGFNLVFFKRRGVGRYVLYSPVSDGPMALLPGYIGNALNYETAYSKLMEIEPTLAMVSMNLIPGDQDATYGTPSLTSDILIQRVESTPERMVNKTYASKFLEFKDIIEVEYSVNYINSDALIKISRHPSGYFFLHFALEPERLSVNQYGDKYYTRLELNGTVTAQDGTLVYQYERDVSLEFDDRQIKEVFQAPVCIRDLFPIIPGHHKFSLLMKNEVSKEFSSIEQEFIIPEEGSGLWMTSPILSYKLNERAPDPNRIHPFQLGNSQLFTQANRVFLKKDSLAIAFQIHGISGGGNDGAEITYRIRRGEEEFLQFSRKLTDYASPLEIIESVPLKEFPPAHYFLDISLVKDGRVRASRTEEFDVTFAEDMARPWFYNKVLPSTSNPIYLYTIGTQFANAGQMEKARASLEETLRKAPRSRDVALSLSRVYQRMEEYGRIPSLLSPFISGAEDTAFDAYTILSDAYQKQEQWAKAVDILDKAIQHFGVNTELLNPLGTCHLMLGDRDKAGEAWSKSLELNANQPEIRKKRDALQR